MKLKMKKNKIKSTKNQLIIKNLDKQKKNKKKHNNKINEGTNKQSMNRSITETLETNNGANRCFN